MKAIVLPVRTEATARASLGLPPLRYRCVACGRPFKRGIIPSHRRLDDQTRCRGFIG
jgi:hypothetical protein